MFIYDLKLQDKYNTCALSKHIGKYVYSARNAGKGEASVSKPHTHITYMLRQCKSICATQAMHYISYLLQFVDIIWMIYERVVTKI
jgi:hypothetical protein